MKMLRYMIMLICTLTFVSMATSCKQDTTDEMEDTAEEAVDELEDAGDEVMDETEDAADEVEDEIEYLVP